MFPEGYKVLPPPAGYMPIRTPARKITATPTPMAGSTGFHIQVEDKSMKGFYREMNGSVVFNRGSASLKFGTGFE